MGNIRRNRDEPPEEPPAMEDISKLKSGRGISMGNIGMGKKK